MIIYVSVVAILVIAAATLKWYGKNVRDVNKQTQFTDLVNAIPQNKLQILKAHTQGIDASFMLLTASQDLENILCNFSQRYHQLQ